MATDKSDPWRWVVLSIFCVFTCSNAIQWLTYAPIETAVKSYFGISTDALNWLSSNSMVVYPVLGFFTCTTFEQWGVRRGVLIGCVCNAVGSILKVTPGVQVRSYAPLIIGQTFNSFAGLFLLSTPPLIAAQYFPPQHRALATAIASTANSIGNAVALFAPPLIVSVGTAHEFYVLFGAEMALCCTVLVAAFFFLKPPAFQAPSTALLRQNSAMTNDGATEPVAESGEEMEGGSDLAAEDVMDGSSTGRGARVQGKATDPAMSAVTGEVAPTTVSGSTGNRGASVDEFGNGERQKPRSVCSRVRHSQEVATFMEVARTIYLLCRNRDFVFLLGAFSISVGSVWTFSSVLAQIFQPFGISATMAGIAGALNVAAGVFGANLVGVWVDRHRRYKYIVAVCMCGSVVMWLALMIVMLTVPSNTNLMTGLSMFMFIFAGVFQGTATPISFEFAMELSYPLAESVPGTMLMVGTNIVALVTLTIASAMLGNGVASHSACVHVVVMMICVCALGAFLSFLPRELLHRREAELLAKERLAELDSEDTPEPAVWRGSTSVTSPTTNVDGAAVATACSEPVHLEIGVEEELGGDSDGATAEQRQGMEG